MFGNSRISFCADGLFGQCQAPHQEPVQYQVSVPVLHKLQEVLKDLMVQGESLNTAAHLIQLMCTKTEGGIWFPLLCLRDHCMCNNFLAQY